MPTSLHRIVAVSGGEAPRIIAACGFLALSAHAFSTQAPPPPDPAAVARAKQCGSHQYANNDGAAAADHFADGAAAQARFLHPLGIAVDAHGVLYVADTGNRVVRKIASDGVVSTLAGTPGRQGCSDGSRSQASFYEVRSIAVDSDGTLFVPDAGTNKLRRITDAGQVSTIAYREEDPAGGQTDARMLLDNHTPMGIAVDASSSIYISLSNAILKVSPNGAATVLTASAITAGAGGVGLAARFNSAYGLAVDSRGTLYVTDSSLDAIKSIAPGGAVTRFAGASYDHAFPQQTSIDGDAQRARFFVPEGIAVDRAGTVYVADRRNSTIRKITPAGVVSTLAGAPRQAGSQDGTGAAARFVSPTAVTVDADGNVFVADSADNTIRKITPAGVVTTVAGVSAYRERVSDASSASPPHDRPIASEAPASFMPPPTFAAAPRALAASLGQLAAQDHVISPREAADALHLPMDKFQWLNDGSGGWVLPSGGFDGTAIRSAVLGYRRQMAADGTTPSGPMQAPWRAAYVSLTINLRDRTCLSAADGGAELKMAGSPVRTPGDLSNGSEPGVKSGLRFVISERGPITKTMMLDRTCARGIWIDKSSFDGRDLPLQPGESRGE
jgi:sugar lactone lactonase YvrE